MSLKMALVKVLLSLLLLQGIILKRVQSATCSKLGPCSCKNSNGGILDLSLLDSHDVSAPRFQGVVVSDNTNLEYDWNPCSSFSYQPDGSYNACKDVAVCQTTYNRQYHYDIGQHNKVSFENGDGDDVVIVYETDTDPSITRIILKCDHEKEADISGQAESPPFNYHMTLVSKHACFTSSSNSAAQSNGLSGGSTILIIFFSLVIVYVIGGVLFLKFYKKAEGTEIIPNKSLWKELPSLTKEGCLFVYGSICSRSPGYTEHK